jgi:hypothetical protein
MLADDVAGEIVAMPGASEPFRVVIKRKGVPIASLPARNELDAEASLKCMMAAIDQARLQAD